MANKSNNQVISETKLLVTLFIKNNFPSDEQLSEMTGISSSTVGRRLTNKDNINEAFGEQGEKVYAVVSAKRTQNLHNARILGAQLSMLNNGNDVKLKLDMLNRDENTQTKILAQIALTYRATLKTLSELFGIDEDELLKRFKIAGIGSLYYSLNYLFNFEFPNQDIARAGVIDFYRNLITVYLQKDTEALNELMQNLTDKKARNIMNNRKSGDSISDDDLETILNYQLKYSLTTAQTASAFTIQQSNYRTRLTKYFADHPDLEERYNALADYHQASRKGNYGPNYS